MWLSIEDKVEHRPKCFIKIVLGLKFRSSISHSFRLFLFVILRIAIARAIGEILQL